jgi:hypothetical protein
MGGQRRQRALGLRLRDEGDEPALGGEEERVQTEELAGLPGSVTGPGLSISISTAAA